MPGTLARSFVRTDNGTRAISPAGIFDVNAVTGEFGSECFFHPVMRPGDVIIASNWIIHSSYRTPEMKKGRKSVEVRFIGDDIDISEGVDVPIALSTRLRRYRDVWARYRGLLRSYD
jgi:hypothetical protein